MADELVNKDLIIDASVKNENGLFSDPVQFGASFQNIVDNVRKSGIATQWSLDQFLDNYLDFLKTNHFIAYGTNVPTNTHVKLWVDTAHNNQNNIG